MESKYYSLYKVSTGMHGTPELDQARPHDVLSICLVSMLDSTVIFVRFEPGIITTLPVREDPTRIGVSKAELWRWILDQLILPLI